MLDNLLALAAALLERPALAIANTSAAAHRTGQACGGGEVLMADDWKPGICYLCDPYGYPFLIPDGGAVLFCWDHRIARGFDVLTVRRSLPFGHERSWKRGTWA